MSSSSPGKWNKSKFLPRITDSKQSFCTDDCSDDFDIDSFDKLLDELTHNGATSNNENKSKDENKKSGLKTLSDFHLPPINDPISRGPKLGMERRRRENEKGIYTTNLETENETYEIGRRTTNILNEELRALVSGVVVPLPPMKTTRISSIVDPMESIPEEPSNTSICEEAHSESNAQTNPQKNINNSLILRPQSQPLLNSPESRTSGAIRNTFFEDTFNTENESTGSSSTSQSSRWSKLSPFDCSIDSPQSPPRCVTSRPRAAKRGALSQQRKHSMVSHEQGSTRKFSYAQGIQRSMRAPIGGNRGISCDSSWRRNRSSSSNSTYTSHFLSPGDVTSRNSRIRSWLRPNITPPTSRESNRSTGDGSYWKSVLSVPSAPSPVRSSFSAGTLPPIQEVSSSSENSSNQSSTSYAFNERTNKIGYNEIKSKVENERSHSSSRDASHLESDKTDTKISVYNQSNDENGTPKNTPPSLNMNIHVNLSSVEGEEIETPHNNPRENSRIERVRHEVTFTPIPVEITPRRPNSKSQESSSSSQMSMRDLIRSHSFPSSDTEETHLSEVSSSVMPFSGTSDSELSDGEPRKKDDTKVVCGKDTVSSDRRQNIPITQATDDYYAMLPYTLQKNRTKIMSKSESEKTYSAVEQVTTPIEMECSTPSLSFVSWKLHSSPLCESSLEKDVCRTRSVENICYNSAIENSFITHTRSLSKFHENEYADIIKATSQPDNKTFILSTPPDPLSYIPSRSPQSYITTWRTLPNVPQRESSLTSTFSICSHASKPVSHISDGSTYTVSSPRKMISSENEQSDVSLPPSPQTYDRYLSNSNIYPRVLDHPFHNILTIDSVHDSRTTFPQTTELEEENNEEDRETKEADGYSNENDEDQENTKLPGSKLTLRPVSSSTKRSYSTFNVNSENDEKLYLEPEISLTPVIASRSVSPISLGESGCTSCTYSVPYTINSGGMRLEITPGMPTETICPQKRIIPFTLSENDCRSCTTDSISKSTSEKALTIHTNAPTNPCRLQKNDETNTFMQYNTDHGTPTSSRQIGVVQRISKSMSCIAMRGLEYIMQRAYPPATVAVCYFNYTPRSSKLSCDSNSIRACQIPCVEGRAHSFRAFHNTQSITDVSCTYRNSHPLILTSRSSITGNKNMPVSINQQILLLNRQLTFSRSRTLVDSETEKYPATQSCTLPPPENSNSEHEISMKEYRIQNKSARTCASESVTSHDTNQEETHSSQTQVTVVENTNYIIVTPAVNKSLMTFSESLIPGTMLVTTTTSNNRTPLFTTPSENDFFHSSLTKIVMTSEASLICPEITDLPAEMENVSFQSDIQESSQKLFVPSENTVPLVKDVSNSTQKIQSLVEESGAMNQDVSSRDIVETDIEIIDLTSVSNDESTKVATECNDCTYSVKCNRSEHISIEEKPKVTNHSETTNEISCSIQQVSDQPLPTTSFCSVNEVNGEFAASVTSQGQCTRSPSPVSSYSFESEETNNKSLSSIQSETVDTSSVTSEANEVNETDLSVCSSRSCFVSSEDLSFSPNENAQSSDFEFSVKNVDYDAAQNLQKNILPENNEPNCMIFGEQYSCSDKVLAELEECHECATISDYIDDCAILPSGETASHTMESVDTNDFNSSSISNFYNIPYLSLPLRSNQSSDFETSGSSTVMVDNSENENDEESMPSIIMGTPPKTTSRGLSLTLPITNDNKECPPSPCGSSEQTTLSPRHLYADSDFESSDSSESRGDANMLHDVCSIDSNYWNNQPVDEFFSEFLGPSREYKADDSNSGVHSEIRKAHLLNPLVNELSQLLPQSSKTRYSVMESTDVAREMPLMSQMTAIVYPHDENACIQTKLMTSNANDQCSIGTVEDGAYSIEGASVDNSSERCASQNSSRSDKTHPNVSESGKSREIPKKENLYTDKKLSNISQETIKSHTSFLDSCKSTKYSRRGDRGDEIHNERDSNNGTSSSTITRFPSFNSHENYKLGIHLRASHDLNSVYERPSSNYLVAEKPDSSESEPTLASHYCSYCCRRAVKDVSKRASDSCMKGTLVIKDNIESKELNWPSKCSNMSTCPSENSNQRHYVVTGSHVTFDTVQKSSHVMNVRRKRSHHTSESPTNHSTNSSIHHNSFGFQAEKDVINQKETQESFSGISLVNSNREMKSSDSGYKKITRKDSEIKCPNKTSSVLRDIRLLESFQDKSIVSETSGRSDKVVETSKFIIPCRDSLSDQNKKLLQLHEKGIKSGDVHVEHICEQNSHCSNKKDTFHIASDLPVFHSHSNSETECNQHTANKNFKCLKKFSSEGKLCVDGNSCKSHSSHSSEKSQTAKRRPSSASKHSDQLKLLQIFNVEEPKIPPFIEDDFRISSKLKDQSLNIYPEENSNEHAVDCLLPVRTLRTYSLEALETNSQLELSLLQLQVHKNSSPKATILRNRGRGVASLVTLPVPSSKSAQPTDSHVGSYRSSFDSDSSDTTNEEPKCQRRHTRPCVQVENRRSSKEFRSPLASSHAFAEKPRKPDSVVGVGDANVEVVYRVWTNNLIPLTMEDVESKKRENPQDISSHFENDFLVPIPSRMLTEGCSEQWLEIKQDASLNVLIGIESNEYRPRSPPPHATRESINEMQVQEVPTENVLLESSQVPGSSINIEIHEEMPENIILHDEGSPTNTRNSDAKVSRKEQKYIGPRYVRFSPDITYIWGTADDTESDVSIDNDDSISKMKFLGHVPSEKLITTRKRQTKKLTGIMKSPSSSPRATQTVTLYHSAADSDSSSFGLISIHKSSVSSRSWCTLDDGADEQLQEYCGEEKYYPLPGMYDDPDNESPDVGAESLARMRGSYDSTPSFTQRCDSPNRSYPQVSPPTRHGRRGGSDFFMSAVESLGETKEMDDFPLAYRKRSDPDFTSDIASPRPPSRHEKTRRKVRIDCVEEEEKTAPEEGTRPSQADRHCPFEESTEVVGEEEEEQYTDKATYDAFRLEKLYSGSSVGETTLSWQTSAAIASASLRHHRLVSDQPSPEEIPSMGEIRLPIRPSSPPYAVRNVLRTEAPSLGGDRRAVRTADSAWTTSARERRLQDRRLRRADRRRERERQQLGVASRRPVSGGDVGGEGYVGGEDGGGGEGGGGRGRLRRRKFARLRECFEGFGDAIASVFSSCCD